MKNQSTQHNTQAMDVQPNNLNQKENKTMKTQLRIASLSLLALICLTVAAIPASANLWDNGPINGTNDAWYIDFGYTVGDSFQLIAASNTVTQLLLRSLGSDGRQILFRRLVDDRTRNASCKRHRQRPAKPISIHQRGIRHY